MILNMFYHVTGFLVYLRFIFNRKIIGLIVRILSITISIKNTNVFSLIKSNFYKINSIKFIDRACRKEIWLRSKKVKTM